VAVSFHWLLLSVVLLLLLKQRFWCVGVGGRNKKPKRQKSSIIMAMSGAPSLDFEALLSREYRPARVTRLQPRESFFPPPEQQQQQRQQRQKIKSGGCSSDDHGQTQEEQQRASSLSAAATTAAAASDHGVMILRSTTSSNHHHVPYTMTPLDLQRQEETRRLVLSLVTQTPEFLMHLEDDERQRVLLQRKDIVQKMFFLPVPASSQQQQYQQRVVDPQFSEVQLGDWQSKIDWGSRGDDDDDDDDADDDDDEDDKCDHDNNNNNNNDDEADDDEQEEDEDDEEDYHDAARGDYDDNDDDDSSEASTVELNDPRLLLQCPRNPFLDHLVFDERTVCWNGDDDELAARAARAPLILELGVAGRSVAKKLYQNTVLSAQRPLPATRHLAYEARMDRDWCGSEEYHALLAEDAATGGGSGGGTFAGSMADISRGTLHHDKEKMEALIQARQVRRAQMAKDKTNRVSAALGTLALGGGRGRAVTSSLMGPGGTERTGRYVSYILCSGKMAWGFSFLIISTRLNKNHIQTKPTCGWDQFRSRSFGPSGHGAEPFLGARFEQGLVATIS
jgi:hypothetical protein